MIEVMVNTADCFTVVDWLIANVNPDLWHVHEVDDPNETYDAEGNQLTPPKYHTFEDASGHRVIEKNNSPNWRRNVQNVCETTPGSILFGVSIIDPSKEQEFKYFLMQLKLQN